MNKKLQNGLTITALMAMAMGVGIPVSTVLAASATTTAPVSTYGISYEGHVQNIGWQKPAVTTTGDQTDINSVKEAGTDGQWLRVEALKISGTNLPAGASITYKAHVQNKGWMPAVSTTGNVAVEDAPEAGTDGLGLRVEAFKITLQGLPGYAVEYQTHVQNKGWMPAVQTVNGTDIENATEAGTDGLGLRMEAVRIELVKTATEKAAEITAIDAVNTAVTTETAETVAAARAAVSNVLDTVENTTLTTTIDGIKVPLAVTSVSAINATQVNITFTNAVDPTSLFTDGKSGSFKSGKVLLTSIESAPVTSGALTGVLSADGKTLTVTAANPLSKRYDITVNNLLGMDGTSLNAYDNVVTFAADTTAPTIVSTTKISASTFKVTFSEPVQNLGTVSYKLADGSVTTDVNAIPSADKTEATFTVGSTVLAGKVVTATFIGVQDQAGNLLTPNPATASFAKGDKDGVAPTVSSITQTGAMTFAVKFSEEILSAPTVSIGGTAINSTKIVQDATDPTIYNVTAPAALNGVTDVAIGTVTDLSGEVASASSKVVTFVEDATAPTVVSSVVSVDATTGKEYLEFTFDKDVNLNNSHVGITSGSYTKNYVTTTLGNITAQTVDYKTVTNKKVLRVALGTLLGTANDASAANYKLNLAFTGITSDAYVAAGTTIATFTRGIDGVAANVTVLPAPADIEQGTDNNKVNVTFTGAVDGASATDVANYKVDGAVIQSVTLEPLSGTTQVAVLNLVAGSNTFTGVRNINVENVKALGSSVAMVPYSTHSVFIKENVAPTVTSAKLTATNQITLTFSEAITDGVNADFEVLVGGKSYSTSEKLSVNVAGTTTGTITLTTAADAAALTSGISIKALTTLDEADGAGNVLSVPANITVVQ